MFEFDKYESSKQTPPSATANTPLSELPKVEKAAFLLWGEHCVECAAPDCYSSCDLYQRRPDGRCRRLEFGMYPNRQLPGLRGASAEVSFARWGKMEARGNALLINSSALQTLESVALTASKLLNTGGRILGKLLKDQRWNYLTFATSERLNAVLRKYGKSHTPDGFLIEAYNPTQQTLSFSLAIAASLAELKRYLTPDAMPAAMQKRIDIPPGNYHQFIPYSEFRTILESGLPFNIALTPHGSDGYHVVFRALDLVKLPTTTPSSTNKPNTTTATVAAKCVVFDLDNTLWNGVLLETDDVKLHPSVNQLLKQLDDRGILLSIASKNGHQHAIEKLRALNVEEYFLFPKINWGAKSESIKQIAKDLNIGLDTFVFIDDNPFELDEVCKALPMVECINVTEMNSLFNHSRLQGSQSKEARERRHMYRASMVRDEAQSLFGEDYTAFLKASNIRLSIRPDQADDFERIAELVQRTNQLNFSGHKYQRDELLRLFEDDGLERFVLSCEDKFGDYGMIGFCMLRRENGLVNIQDLMLSCRVQGKFIESALLHFLCHRPGQSTTAIAIHFQKTDRNTPAQHVLMKLGFDLNQPAPLTQAVTSDSFAVDFIAIVP